MQIHTSADLDKAIEEMERKRKLQEGMLSDRFHAAVDHFKPGNLIKSAFSKVVHSDDTKSKVLKTAGGIGAGFLVKNLILGNPTSIIGKIAGNALKAGATNTVLHNSDKISAWGTAIYKNLFKKKDKKD